MVLKHAPDLVGRHHQTREEDGSSLSTLQEGHKAPVSATPGAGAMEGAREKASGVAPEHSAREGEAQPASSGPVAEARAHAPADSRQTGRIPTEGSSASSTSPHGSTSGRSAGLPLGSTWSPTAEAGQVFSPSPQLTHGSGGRDGGASGPGRGGVGSRSSRTYYETAARVMSSLAHVGSVSARNHHEAAERATRSPSGASPITPGLSASGRGYAEIAGRAVPLWDSDSLYGSSLEDDLGPAPFGRTASHSLADPGFSFGRAGSFKSLGLKKGFLDRYRVGEGLGVGNWSKVYRAESVRGAGAGPSSSRAASEVSAPVSIGGRLPGAPLAHRAAGAGGGAGPSTVAAGVAAIELEGSLPGHPVREAGAGSDTRGPGEEPQPEGTQSEAGGAGAGGEGSLGAAGGGKGGSKNGQGGSWISRQLRKMTEGKQGQGKVPVVISSNDFAPGAAGAAAEAQRQRQQEEGGEEDEEEGCYTSVPPMSGYAVKIIEKEKLGMASQDAFESVAREIEAQRALTAACPGQVVRLVEAYEDLTSIFLLMERCEGGDLVAEMLARGAKLEEAGVRRVMRNLLLALAHCGLHGVVHRDIKPENLLLARPSDLTSLKLCDFGLAVILPPGETLTGCMGTAAYAAPEVLGEQAYDSGADVWSAGVVAYTLLSGGRPFWGKTFAELVRAVRHNAPCFRGPPWEGVSPEAMGFVDMLLARDPRLRPSPVQALCHPWIHSAQLGAALPLDWKLLLPSPPSVGTPEQLPGGGGNSPSGAKAGAETGEESVGARLEATYLDAQTRCVRIADGKRSGLDKTQRSRLKALAKMPGDELHRAVKAVLRGSVLASPALMRGSPGYGGREGEEEIGNCREEEGEAEGPIPRQLAAVTEEES